MPSTTCTSWTLGSLAVLALLATSAAGADPLGPAIGAKNKYTTSLKDVATTVDTDVYTGALIEGEALTVKVAAAKGASLKPGIKLIQPGGAELVPEVKRNKKGNKATLKGFPIGITGLWGVEVFGTEDFRHPLVAEMQRWGDVNISGPIEVLQVPPHNDYRDLRMTPAQTRAHAART